MKPWKLLLDPSKDKLTGAELQMGLLGTQLVCKLILVVLTRDVGGINFAATMLEFSFYRVFKLGLYENKRLLGHQKCTFKS